ncbi:hypothetical protein HQN87_16515 [Paenibacillus tritici]|uniref:Uncharacterized protein n=1 Tax=Paenibacillus tritici TaxID=1873425 RepID=A0ABX2DQI5_9BACL|nr:hypothetical protein [Paenibacillus tritici]NQX46943.1 hypothetical protein [Paenibacillus tritici]
MIKLNTISCMYALLLFIELQLMGNVNRLSRVTGLEFILANRFISIFNIIIFILGTAFFVFYTNKHFKESKLNYFTAILWLPYFAFFIFVFTSIWPIDNPAERVPPVHGLLATGAVVIYPFYITFINLLSTLKYN